MVIPEGSVPMSFGPVIVSFVLMIYDGCLG